MGRALLAGSLALLGVALVGLALLLSREESRALAQAPARERVREATIVAELAPASEVAAAEPAAASPAGEAREVVSSALSEEPEVDPAPPEVELAEGELLVPVSVRHEQGGAPGTPRARFRSSTSSLTSQRPVVGAGGRPASEGFVRGWNADLGLVVSGKVESDGSFRIERLPRGPVELRAEGESGVSKLVSAYAGVGDVVLVLEPAATVSGRLTDGEGEAVSGAVELQSDEPGALDWFHESSGVDFRFEKVLPGRYRLIAKSPEAGLVAVRRLEVGPGAEQGLGDVRMEPGATLVLRGSVHDDRVVAVGPLEKPLFSEVVRAGALVELLVPAGRTTVVEFTLSGEDELYPGQPTVLVLEPGERLEIGP